MAKCEVCDNQRPDTAKRYCTSCALEARRESDRRYREANRLSRIQSCAEWRAANPDKYSKGQRDYRSRNRATRNEYSKRYYNTVDGKWSHYKSAAKRRKLPWSLSKEVFGKLIALPCSFCGQPESGGVDRTDSSAGYHVENCTPCCGLCNRMKMDSTVDDFLNHVRKIQNHLNPKDKP